MARKSSTNYGIQSQHVAADNLAIGENARINVVGDYARSIGPDLEKLRAFVRSNPQVFDSSARILEKIDKIDQESKKSGADRTIVEKSIRELELLFSKGKDLVDGSSQFLTSLERISRIFS